MSEVEVPELTEGFMREGLGYSLNAREREWVEALLKTAAEREHLRTEELELLLEQAQRDPTCIDRAAAFADGFDRGRSQERQRVREAFFSELESAGFNADGEIPADELALAFDRILERAALDTLEDSDG